MRETIQIGKDQTRLDHESKAAVIHDHVKVIKHLEGFVEDQLTLLRPVTESWQPSDVLPNLVAESWSEEIERLRVHAQGLPDDILVVLIGNMITEEALPAYQTMINRHPGVADQTGTSENPWAQWGRGWTAEENRHGELLNKYLYLSGRVDMRAVEITTQHLIRNGFNPQTGNDPYHGLIYTAFQERATRCSHGHMAQLAIQHGDTTLGRMCNLIAGDEARHEEAYKRFVGKIVDLDPPGAVLAVAQMMKTKIVMPASRMSDGRTHDLFGRFSAVAQRIGVYTVRDYADIIEHLIEYWQIPRLTGLSGEALDAQEYLCGLAGRYRKIADRLEGQPVDHPHASFSWIFDRVV